MVQFGRFQGDLFGPHRIGLVRVQLTFLILDFTPPPGIYTTGSIKKIIMNGDRRWRLKR